MANPRGFFERRELPRKANYTGPKGQEDAVQNLARGRLGHGMDDRIFEETDHTKDAQCLGEDCFQRGC